MNRYLSFTLLGVMLSLLVMARNEISNGDFELSKLPGTSCWTTIGTQTYTIENVGPLSGTNSAKIITGVAGASISSQGIYQMMNFPKASTYTVSFKAKASVACNLQSMLSQSFNPYTTLARSPSFNLTTTMQSFSFSISVTGLTGLCKFGFYYGNILAGTNLWLDDIVVQESTPLTNLNLCNGDFETTMNNAMYTLSGYNYNFRASGTSTDLENQYYGGWTKLRLSMVTDTAAVIFDASANKISGAKSLKYTMVANGTVHGLNTTDQQFVWFFAGVRNKNYTVSFKAKSSINLNVGFAITNWGAVNYLPERSISLTPTASTYVYTTSTPINQSDNRTALSFYMGKLPAGASVWIDDVNLYEGRPVSGLALSAANASISVNSSFQHTATVLPLDAAITSVNWNSNNSTIATVDATGNVTAVAVGTVNITATTLDGGFTASTLVTVSAKANQELYPSPIPIGTEVINPGRGFYRWNNVELLNVPSIDNYLRINWSDVESATTPGVYDFNTFDAQADYAKNNPNGRGTLGLGIRCVVEGLNHAYPAYLDNSSMKHWYSTAKKCWVPDWNEAYFLERMDSMVAALGRKFNSDPRIGFVEIRTYGNWGEWHLSGFETAPTPIFGISAATVYRMIDAYIKAFPDKQIIMMSDHPVGLEYALSKTGLKYPIGWRRDSWCNQQFVKMNYGASSNQPTRWKTAPVIVESYTTSGVTAKLGLQQIIDYHVSSVGNGQFGDTLTMSNGAKDSLKLSARTAGYRNILRSVSYPSRLTLGQELIINSSWSNVGVAPLYYNWMVSYRLSVAKTTTVVWESTSKLDLRKLLPTYNYTTQVDIPVQIVDTLIIPSNLSASNYELEIIISDPADYYAPLSLAIDGRKANGAYGLGSVLIDNANALNDIEFKDTFSILKFTSSQIQIDVHQACVYGIAIYSMDGSCVYVNNELKLDNNIHLINLTKLSKGIFAVKIFNQHQQKVIRFISN